MQETNGDLVASFANFHLLTKRDEHQDDETSSDGSIDFDGIENEYEDSLKEQ